MTRLLKAALLIMLISIPFSSQGENITDFVRADISTSKRSVFAGEAFEVFLTVRYHSIILGQDFNLTPVTDPAIRKISEEFSRYPDDQVINSNRIDNIRKFSWQALAVSTGSVELASTLDLSVLTRNTSLFFSRQNKAYFTIPVTGATLSILPLPQEGRPADFSGAVGGLSLNVEVSPTTAAPGDVVKIRSEISGTGFLDNATAPILSSIDGLRIYDPKVVSSAPRLIFEQQVVPLTKEALNLPAVSFSFFDPVSRSYRTLRKGPFPLTFRDAPLTEDVRFRPDEANSTLESTELPGNPVSPRTTAAGGAIILLLLIAVLLRLRRDPAPLTAFLSIVLLAALLGTASYVMLMQSGYFHRNVYLVKRQQKGTVAPSLTSKQTTLIPSGRHVEYLACSDGWVLVRYADRQCWIPESSLDMKAAKAEGKAFGKR